MTLGRVRLGEIQQLIEAWLPPATAWSGDNVGVQIGRADAQVRNILLALDVTLEVGQEALRKNANLIITHHPLFFHPLRALTDDSRAGKIALYLAERKINLYAAHTNLDHARVGVSAAMADLLGLMNCRPLSPLQGKLLKVTVNVPESHLDTVADGMHRAGAGKFLNYEECSFRSRGTGTFRGTIDATPFIGKKGILEKTPEIKLEVLVERWKLRKVLAAMRERHPYEEIAYDIIPLENASLEQGLGVIGEFKEPLSKTGFLALVKRAFRVPAIRYAGTPTGRITRVAVCGGAGLETAEEALRQHADALVTADVKYHGFQEHGDALLLIDAGHFETEAPVLPVVASRLREILRAHRSSSKVFVTRKNTNPICYF